MYKLSEGRYNSSQKPRYTASIPGHHPLRRDAVTNLPKVHGTYAELVLHPNWKSRRKEILERDAHKCVICKSSEQLQVHHRQYHFIEATKEFKVPWDYSDKLLVTLCSNCHGRGHSKFKVPIIKI